ncbi:MAG: YfhO family protein [Crocinitomicaceae bacterium]|nr:YfhO family protein [Crocinitomicaceae bacterium]
MIKKSYFPYIVLFVLAITALFQVVFFIHPLKFDSIDCFYPWRFYIGECLQNGQLPYWNPYQDLGYPIHADPSSGAWYPMVWLIGYFNGYTVYSLAFEMWFHVFIGGVGFFLLAKQLKFDKKLALFAGMSYMLCGLFVGNAQHLPYLISAAWLPFVILFYFKLATEKSYWNSVKAAFFLFLMVTGGYPAFTIILFYLFVIFFVIYFIKTWENEPKQAVLHFIGRHALFLVYTVLLCLGLFISIYKVSPYLSRLGDFSLEQALFSPFTPQSFVSFLLPYTTTLHSDYFNSDLSMRNGYFGLFAFLFFIGGLFLKKPLEIKVLFYFGLFSLMAAVGEYLPIRAILFDYIPMMNIFRFPSVFRLFFIIAALLTALVFLKKQFESNEWKVKQLIYLSGISMILFIVLVMIARTNGYLDLGSFFSAYLFHDNEKLSFWQAIAFHSLFQIAILSLFLLVLWKVKERSKIMLSLLVLTGIDLIISTQLNAPATVYYERVKTSEAHENVSKYPLGFPKQKAISIEEGGHLPNIGQPYWQNQTTFQKQFSAEGFNSFSFTSYEFIESEYPQLFSELKKNSNVLLSDSIVSEKYLKQYKKDSLFTAKQLFFSPTDYTKLIKFNLHHSVSDNAHLTSYDAANFTIKSNVKQQQLLTLFQKHYTGWKAFVDNKEVTIYKSDLNFMSVILPAGKHTVEFRYSNPALRIAWVLSLLGSLIAISSFFFNVRRENR